VIEVVSSAAPSGKAGRGKKRPKAPLDRVLRALNHPLRRRILRALIDGEASASALSRQLGIDLGVVSYHLSQVLGRECGVVELTRTAPRRGALEKFYRLRLQALTEGDSLPAASQEGGPRVMSLEECFIVAVGAMEGDAFETEGSGWDWFLAKVDADGWGEICQARDEFNQRARAAVEASQARGEEAEARDVVVGATAFPAVPPPAR
jgi:DNA-binding transcriptional ArsR family regulator